MFKYETIRDVIKTSKSEEGVFNENEQFKLPSNINIFEFLSLKSLIIHVSFTRKIKKVFTIFAANTSQRAPKKPNEMHDQKRKNTCLLVTST